MAFMHWRDAYETGNFTYDDQHRALLALVSQMRGMLQHPDACAEASLQLRFETFTDLVEMHCETENQLMEAIGHHTESSHTEAHRAFLLRLRAIKDKGEFGPAAHPEILQSLDTFASHFEDDDEQQLIRRIRAGGPFYSP